MGKFGAFGIGLVAVVIAVGAVLFMQRGSHLELTGSILKVRMAALDDNSCVVVLDYRVTNPSDLRFQIRNVEIEMVADGKNVPTTSVIERDAQTLFDAYPILGAKYNKSLITRDNIQPKSTEDHMAAARIDLPLKDVEGKAKFTLRIEESDGGVSAFEVKK